MSLLTVLLVVPSASAQLNGSRYNDFNPYYGAISLTNGPTKCTAGIRVKVGVSIYLTTAAHCFPLGNKVWNGPLTNDHAVGNVLKRNTGVDTELISLPNDGESPDGKFWLDGKDFKKVSTLGPVIEHATGLSFSGQTSGVVGGLSMYAINQTFTLPNGEGVVNNAFYMEGPCGFTAQPGDSGSPVYYSSLGTTQVLGFVIGTRTDTVGCRYTAAVPARAALSALGVSAITE